MKYQVIETYTDSSGTHETYRSKKYTDKKDAVREKACSMVLRLQDYDKWVKTKWDIIEIEE
jgi:hypothetical protein